MILQFAILIGQTTGLFLFFKLEHNITIYEQNNRTKMQKYTERYEVKLTKEISDTLEELRNRKIVVSKFIRLAIEEKLQRDFKPNKKQNRFELRKLKDLYPTLF